jgi:hypothetical protein
MGFESILLSAISLCISIILFYFGIRSFLIENIKFEEFLIHLNLSWFILGLLWLVIGFIELIFGITSFSSMNIIKILLFFAIPFLLEISLFYNSLFSNRISFLETYVPILIGVSFGLNFGSLLISNELLDNFVLLFLTITGVIVFIEFLIMNQRFRKILKFGDNNEQVSYFFRKIVNVTLLLIIASTADAFIFISILVDVSLVSFASFLTFIFLLVVSILIIFENRKILINFKTLDVSLILNEIN